MNIVPLIIRHNLPSEIDHIEIKINPPWALSTYVENILFARGVYKKIHIRGYKYQLK